MQRFKCPNHRCNHHDLAACSLVAARFSIVAKSLSSSGGGASVDMFPDHQCFIEYVPLTHCFVPMANNDHIPFLLGRGKVAIQIRAYFVCLSNCLHVPPSAFIAAMDLGAPSLLTPVAATSIFLLLPFRLQTPLIVSFFFPLPIY